MIKSIKKIIFPTLLLLVVLAFYLLDKDIRENTLIIVGQQKKIEEYEIKIASQQNVLLFQGARLRDLERRIVKVQARGYAKYE
tara:strand:+ start:6920 stop:7168 length:249 start_codon:yes stop_codon:yes gene_type:complete